DSAKLPASRACCACCPRSRAWEMSCGVGSPSATLDTERTSAAATEPQREPRRMLESYQRTVAPGHCEQKRHHREADTRPAFLRLSAARAFVTAVAPQPRTMNRLRSGYVFCVIACFTACSAASSSKSTPKADAGAGEPGAVGASTTDGGVAAVTVQNPDG